MEKKFTSLAYSAILIKFFGWLISLVGSLFSVAYYVYTRNPYQDDNTWIVLISLVAMIFMCILVGTIITAIGHFIECIMSIEENTRKAVGTQKTDSALESL